jgi:hypothetical protein
MDVWADCFHVNVFFFLWRYVRENGWGLDPHGRIACGFLGGILIDARMTAGCLGEPWQDRSEKELRCRNPCWVAGPKLK